MKVIDLVITCECCQLFDIFDEDQEFIINFDNIKMLIRSKYADKKVSFWDICGSILYIYIKRED